MRMSCNGCRVLRKGCSETCSIRPCLQWIKSPESQANATVFLAKFYGRAGLMNLINAGTDHLRPAIFRSLLYEACGRIVNPIYGSVGLLWSGSWQLCQAAVEAVLKGAPITQIPTEAAADSPAPPNKDYDIRHVTKDSDPGAASTELHKVTKTRTRFKRSSSSTAAKPRLGSDRLRGLSWTPRCPVGFQRERSHESSGAGDRDSAENESMFSVETVEASHVSQGEPSHNEGRADEGEGDVELDLTLGFDTAGRGGRAASTPATAARWGMSGGGDDNCQVGLGLDLPA